MDAIGLNRESPRESGEGNPPLRVVIAYHDLMAGKRAMRMLDNVARQFGDELQFVPIPWAFDLLGDADWRTVAASDAIRADILILATSDTAPLPTAVGQWAENTIQRKFGTSAAVVALFGPEGEFDPPGSARLKAIRAATQQAGLDFFAPEAALEEEFERIHRRAEWVTPFLDEILHHDHCRPTGGEHSTRSPS